MFVENILEEISSGSVSRKFKKIFEKVSASDKLLNFRIMFPLSGHTCYYILEKEKKAFPSSTKFVVNTYVDNFSLGKINEAPFFSKSPYILLLPPSIRLLIREAGLQIIVLVIETLLSTSMKQWNDK